MLARMGKNGAFCKSKRSGIPASEGKFRQGRSEKAGDVVVHVGTFERRQFL